MSVVKGPAPIAAAGGLASNPLLQRYLAALAANPLRTK